MLRRLAAAAVVVALGASQGTEGVASPQRYEYAEGHMGTSFRLVFWAPDARVAETAAAAAFAVVADLDRLLSDYSADSEVALLSAAAGSGRNLDLSASTAEVLRLARVWAERTGGAFDPTSGPLTRLWRWAARRGELPSAQRLAAARAAVDYELLWLASEGCAARLEHAGMGIDLGGIAKGFAADRALAALRVRGVAAALVDAGGDLALGEPPPGDAGWRVQATEGTWLLLSRVAVATSGDRYRYLEIGGERYSHLIDPRTGLGVVDAPEVTVVAPDATTADVLASALSVMDPVAGAALIASVPGAAARVSGSREWHSDSFPGPLVRPHAGVDR